METPGSGSYSVRRALLIITVDDVRGANFAGSRPFGRSQISPDGVPDPGRARDDKPRKSRHMLCRKVFAECRKIFAEKPVSILVPSFSAAIHPKRHEQVIVMGSYLQYQSFPWPGQNLSTRSLFLMPRAKKRFDSSSSKKNSSTNKAPVTQSPVVNPGKVLVAPVTEEQVRLRAYELFLQRGGFWGNPEQDWFQAEAEVRARHTS
jgi:hypothetical protein